MTSDVLNVQTLVRLAALADACQRTVPCVMVDESWGHPVEVVARAFVRSDDDMALLSSDDDVRDGAVWFSGTTERAVSVRDLLTMLEEGRLALDYRLSREA